MMQHASDAACLQVLGGLENMGFLDQVISAALGSTVPPAQGQPARSQSPQDQLSQIAAALQALLAPRLGAAPTGQSGATPTSAGEHSSPSGLDVLIDKF